MIQEIQRQIEFLENELAAVKMRYNSAGFDCTSAPAILVKQYRDSIRRHLQILRINLES